MVPADVNRYMELNNTKEAMPLFPEQVSKDRSEMEPATQKFKFKIFSASSILFQVYGIQPKSIFVFGLRNTMLLTLSLDRFLIWIETDSETKIIKLKGTDMFAN